MEKTIEQRAVRGRSQALSVVMAGLLAALGCVATLVLQVPSPTGGYMNLGDTVVILGAYLMGPVWGAVAGGVGPALADLISGYAVYVPATLIIKAIMGLLAAGLYRALHKKNWAMVVCGVAAEAVMVVGYWLFDAILAAASSGASFSLCLAGSAVGLPSNLMQAAFGLAASTFLAIVLKQNRYVRRIFPEF